MTTTTLASIILAVCGASPDFDYDKRADCYENILNCAVGPGGKIKEKKLQQCLDGQGKGKKDAEEVRSTTED